MNKVTQPCNAYPLVAVKQANVMLRIFGWLIHFYVMSSGVVIKYMQWRNAEIMVSALSASLFGVWGLLPPPSRAQGKGPWSGVKGKATDFNSQCKNCRSLVTD
jgi:hypothetical protein